MESGRGVDLIPFPDDFAHEAGFPADADELVQSVDEAVILRPKLIVKESGQAVIRLRKASQMNRF